jgi:hypothetical protein
LIFEHKLTVLLRLSRLSIAPPEMLGIEISFFIPTTISNI